ncbi:MAG TPA: PA domain-containing protein, partial [Luteibaculaceae bacterium]|nr:PA domain-containing protein [Luteibaculaceae bacterium]
MKKLLLSAFGVVILGALANAQVIFNVKTPANLAGNYQLTVATGGWGTPDMNIPANAVENQLVFVGPDTLACTDPENGAALAGKIAVLYRGSCEFGAKALRAQTAGAIAVVIINNSGAPVAMGAGAQGANVTIPTIMISTSDGALLRNEILAGNVTAFIGTKVGLFANDLGYKENQIVYPGVASIPITMTKQAGQYEVAPGVWVYNFGNQAQTGSVRATITRAGGTVVYNETQSGLALAPGDSIFASFPVYSPAWTQDFEYTLSYEITSGGGADGFPDDNAKSAVFTINNTTHSAAPIDFATGLPVANSFIRSGTAAPNRYCAYMRDTTGSQQRLKGFSFALTPNTGLELTNEFIEIEMYEWNDVFTDINDATFEDLNPIAFAEYSYTENLANVSVYAPTSDNIVLQKGQRYLACLKQLTDNYFIGFNNGRDYNATIDRYLEPVSVVESGGTFFSAGFGTNTTFAMGIHTEPVNVGINDNASTLVSGAAYPVPAAKVINIPLGAKKEVSNVIVFDQLGRKTIETSGTMA